MTATTAIFKPVENARPANAAFKPARLPFASRDRGVTFKSGRTVAPAPTLPGTTPPSDGLMPDTVSPDIAPPRVPDSVPSHAPTTEPKPQPSLYHDALASARDEAYAAGHTAGREEAMAELETARTVFAAAHAALTCAPASMETLVAQIEEAVLRLASERAGLAIDSTPAPFLRRIEQLASTISQATADMSVMLNPADLDAIAPHLPDSQTKAFRFYADATLRRGDARLTQPMVMLNDLLREGPE